ncbi:MAG TPA: Lrp/AsnC family transcriptional regulator [Kofleriaceae bacterium]|nr:Lrp/AsnC family transcriptional regulator [Kofleriaceae bacterium]
MKRLRSSFSHPAGIDAVDAKLLRLLEKSSRTSTADLARALGMAPPSVAERIRRLEEAGVIRRFTVEVDPAALGYALAAYVRIRPASGQISRIVELVATIPEIVECDRVTGDDCFLARVHVRSVEELERLIDRITPYAQTNTSIIQSSPVKRRLPAL